MSKGDLDLDDFDLELDIDLDEEEIPLSNRNNIVINVMLIVQLAVCLVAFIVNCWLIGVDQGGPAILVFFLVLIAMGITLFIMAAKWYLKWILINEV